MEKKYLLDNKEGYNGSIISTIYTNEEGVQYVDFSSQTVYKDGNIVEQTPNLTVSQYADKKGIEPLVLTWDELSKLIKDYEDKEYLSKKWIEISEDKFYNMFEILPPLKLTYFKPEGFFFLISEATTGSIHDAFIEHNKKYYTAPRCRTQKPVDLFNQLLIQIGEL